MLLFSVALALGPWACVNDLPGATSPAAARSGDEAPIATGSDAPPPRSVDMTRGAVGQPRPRTQTRVWIGLWCDRDSARGGGEFVVSFDGVEMYRADARCRDPKPFQGNAVPPNGGSVAFTLNQGSHVLAVTTPDNDGLVQRVSVFDDTWIVVDHRRNGDGAFTTAASLRDAHLAFDTVYDPGTRPVANREASATRPAGAAPEALPPSGGDPVADFAQPGTTAPEGPPDRAGVRRDAPGRPARPGPGAAGDDEWLEGSPAYLSVTVDTPATVIVGGRTLSQQAPFDRATISAGTHRVEIRPDDPTLPPRTFSITIDAGQHRTLAYPRR